MAARSSARRASCQPRDPPAGRPDRDLHAVEFPDLSAGEEGQRRARRRLHRHLAPAARNARAARTELFRALADAGIPKGVAQLVHGDADLVSDTLIASRVIRKVSFTGSTNVGKHLMRLCADSMTRVTMELGGHAPVLIFDDCDLEKTLDMVVPQKFRNAGQVCVSPTRFYVQSGIYDAFVKGFAERTAKVKVGNGLEADTKMGPLANERRPDAIGALVEDAKAKGARVLAGGERGDGGFFFQPTLLADVPNEADIMNDEPFGPVAVSRPFDTFDEAIEQANRLPYGLAAFAFTENGRRANLIGDLRRKRHGRDQHLRHLAAPTRRSAGSRIQASAPRAARKGWRATRW